MGGAMPSDAAGDAAESSETSLQRRATLVLGEFLAAWLVSLHRAFRGDLVSALILGEIATSNLRGVRAGHGCSGSIDDLDRLDDGNGGVDMTLLRPCNALSISASTGVPRETVRRKVEILIDKGLVRRIARNKLLLDGGVASAFIALDRRVVAQFLETARRLERLSAESTAARRTTPPAEADRPPPVP